MACEICDKIIAKITGETVSSEQPSETVSTQPTAGVYLGILGIIAIVGGTIWYLVKFGNS